MGGHLLPLCWPPLDLEPFIVRPEASDLAYLVAWERAVAPLRWLRPPAEPAVDFAKRTARFLEAPCPKPPSLSSESKS